MKILNEEALREKSVALGDSFKNKNGMVGTIENIQGIARLVVRNAHGKAIQTISIKDIDFKKFEKINKG